MNWSSSKTIGVVAGVVVPIVALVVGAVGLSSSGPDADKLSQSAKVSDRVASIDLLRKSKGEAARETLFRLSADKDPGVAMTAVWALGEHRTAESREMLERVLADTQRNGCVRSEAAAGLGLCKDTDPNMLVQVLRSDKDPMVRAGAAKGLMALRSLRTLPDLVKALEDPDERVREWACKGAHKMMVRRFPFDPVRPPEEQRQVIEEIQHYITHSMVPDRTHIVGPGHEDPH